MILLLLLVASYSPISAAPVEDEESGWWDMLSSHLPLWYSNEESPDDNDEEIKNSVKLLNLFPTLKEKLESSDEKEQEEAKEFINKMNSKIKEKKRYTYMIWKGVKTIVDMGRVDSNERRSNEEQVGFIWRFIQGFIDLFKWVLGVKSEDDKKDKEEDKNKEDKHKKSSNKSKKDHESSDKEESQMHIVPTHHSPPPSDPKAGLKDEKDRFEGKPAEIIDEEQSTLFHVPTHHTLPPSDPKARTKDELDRLEGAKPAEVIHN